MAIAANVARPKTIWLAGILSHFAKSPDKAKSNTALCNENSDCL
jgi:hypothetical protein